MNDLPADAPMMKDETSVFYLSTNDIHQKAQILKGLTFKGSNFKRRMFKSSEILFHLREYDSFSFSNVY